jgi:ribosomal protein S18 acetylase RimI-like enzyme
MKARPIQARDIASARRLDRKVFPGKWSGSYYLQFLERHEAAVIGFPVTASAFYALNSSGKPFHELISIAVQPDLRSSGLGANLILYLKRKGLPIRCWVKTKNQKALRFYAREGFQTLSRKHFDGCDWFRLVWDGGRKCPT